MPRRPQILWRYPSSGGLCSSSSVADETKVWCGTGWTGQPAIVRDKGDLYLVVGGLDHNLHKIEMKSGGVVWEYAYDDIIKSSPTVIEDPHPAKRSERYLVLAGSRRGFPSDYTDPSLAPYRAVSFSTGKEVWRLPVPLTASYSRDVDGSGFFFDKRMYSGVESGWFYKLDPFRTLPWNGYQTPRITARRLLIGDPGDASAHGGNLVLEASPSLIGDTVYISSGSGHVYGSARATSRWCGTTGPAPTSTARL